MSTESEKAAGMVAAMASALKKNKELHEKLHVEREKRRRLTRALRFHVSTCEADICSICEAIKEGDDE